MNRNNSDPTRRSTEESNLVGQAMEAEQTEHTDGHNAPSGAAPRKALSKRSHRAIDTNTHLATASRKRHRIYPPSSNTADSSAGLHDCEATHGVGERSYDVAKMKGNKWQRVRAKLEHELGERERYSYEMVMWAIEDVNEEDEDEWEDIGNENGDEERRTPPTVGSEGGEDSECQITNADMSPSDIETRQLILTRIEVKWGMPPVDVIPDGMRAHFNHPMDPLKWSLSVLLGLCQIVDECPQSMNFNTLRGVLYDAYMHRIKSRNETKELSYKDVEYVLDWMKGKQLEPSTEDNEAAARHAAGQTIEHSAPGQSPSLPPVREARTPRQSEQQLSTSLQPILNSTSLTWAGRKLAEAEANLSASIASRRVLEANLTVARNQREVEVLQSHRPTGEIDIMKAELAVSEARVEVQEARLGLIELRKKIYKQAGGHSGNLMKII
jgi:hypothetical protein